MSKLLGEVGGKGISGRGTVMSNGIEDESIRCLWMWTGRGGRAEAPLSYTSCSIFFAVLSLQMVRTLGREVTRLD